MSSYQEDIDLREAATIEQKLLIEKESKQQEAKWYLERTDWIISKISEASINGTDISSLKEKYSEELSKRYEARIEINA